MGHTDSGGDEHEQDVGVLDVTTARHGIEGVNQYEGLRIDVPDDSWEALTVYNGGDDSELFAIDTRNEGGEVVRLGAGVNFVMRNITSQLMQNSEGKHNLQTMRLSAADDLTVGGSTEPDTGAGNGLGIQSLILEIPQDGAWVDAAHSDRKDQFKVQYGDGLKTIYHAGNDTNLAKLDAANVFTGGTSFFTGGNLTVRGDAGDSTANGILYVGKDSSNSPPDSEGGEIRLFGGKISGESAYYNDVQIDSRLNDMRIFTLAAADHAGGQEGSVLIYGKSAESVSPADYHTRLYAGLGNVWGWWRTD